MPSAVNRSRTSIAAAMTSGQLTASPGSRSMTMMIRLLQSRQRRTPGMDLQDTCLHQADQSVEIVDAQQRAIAVLWIRGDLDAAAQTLPGVVLGRSIGLLAPPCRTPATVAGLKI